MMKTAEALPQATVLVKARKLSISEGPRAVCVDHLEVLAGTRVCVLGRSGSGKSALLRAVAETSSIRACETTLASENDLQSLWSSSKMVEKALREWFPRGKSGVVAEALERLDLWEVRRARLRTLSAAQLSGLLIERALGSSAPLLIIDGLFDCLDRFAAARLWELVDIRIANGGALLFSSRSAEQARLAERILIIERGTVRAQGTEPELVARVAADTLTIESSDPLRVSGILYPFEIVIRQIPGGLEITAPDGQATAARLIREGYGFVRAVTIRRPTLQDAWDALRRR